MAYSDDWISMLDDAAIAALGASLRRIDPRFMKSSQRHPGATRTWFQGKEPYFDLVFETEADDIIWFQITLRGKSLSWNQDQPTLLQAGETNELDVPAEVNYYSASKTIEGTSDINHEFLGLVIALLKTHPEDPLFAQMGTKLKALESQY